MAREYRLVNGVAQSANLYAPATPDATVEDNWQEEQIAQREAQLLQAVTRGQLTPEQALESMQGAQRTWWDKMLGFEQSSHERFGGAVGSAVIDIVSAPVYAMSALAKAGVDSSVNAGNAVSIGGLKFGFSPSAFADHWKNRGTYTDIAVEDMDLGWGVGLAMDIALDPTTWLTFGIGAGTKVTAKAGSKIAGETLQSGRTFTLTRHGSDVYEAAARRMEPDIARRVEAQAASRAARGQTSRLGLEMEELRVLHDEISDFMVRNYDDLATEVFENRGRFARTFQRGKMQRNLDLAGGPLSRTVDDLFEETATRAHREIGLGAQRGGVFAGALGGAVGAGLGSVVGDAGFYVGGALGGGVGVKLAASAYGKSVRSMFNRTEGVPSDVEQAWYRTKNSIHRQAKLYYDDLNQRFKGTSKAQRTLISHILEEADESIVQRAPTGRILGALVDGKQVDAKTLELAEFVRKEFDSILKLEQDAGFAIESLGNYVSHMYTDPSARRIVSARIREHQGKYWAGLGKHSFEYHRAIATLEEAINTIGTGHIETDIAEIIARRKAASIKMIGMDDFHTYLKETAGMPALIMFNAMKDGKVTARTLKQMLRDYLPKVSRPYDYDQYMSVSDTLGQKLGFSFASDGGPAAAVVTSKNLDLLDYLSKDVAGRNAPLMQRVGANSYAQVSGQAKRTFKVKHNEQSFDIDAIDFFRAVSQDENPLDLLWASMGNTGNVGLGMKDVGKFVRAADKYMRKNFEVPLGHAFPDFFDKLEKSMKATPRFGWTRGKHAGKKLRKKAGESLQKLRDDVSAEVVAKGVDPQLPNEFVKRAQYWRMRTGDFTDAIPVSESQLEELSGFQSALGLSPQNMIDIAEALLGKRGLKTLNKREADRLTDFLGYHITSDVSKQNISDVGRHELFGENAEEVIFQSRKAPQFGDIDEIMRLRKRDDAPSLAGAGRRSRMAQIDKLIESKQRILNYLREEVARYSQGKVPKALPRAAQERLNRVTALTEHIEEMEDSIRNLSSKRAGLAKKADEPLGESSTAREYIGREEVLELNGEVLSKQELEMLGKRHGFRQVEATLSSIMGKDAAAAARKLARRVSQKVKASEKQVKGLTDELLALEEAKVKATIGGRKLDEKVSFTAAPEGAGGALAPPPAVLASKEIDKLDAQIATKQKKLAFAERKLERILDSAKEKKVTILGDGRYRVNETGKIYDLLLGAEGRSFNIHGKHMKDIERAIVSDMALHGRKKLSGYRVVRADDVPQAHVGTEAKAYYFPKSIARLLKEIEAPLYGSDYEGLNTLLRGYDAVTQFFKISLLGPWGATWMRNAIGNVSQAYIRAGVALFHPKRFSEFMKIYNYGLAMESPTWAKMRGITEKQLDRLGRQPVSAVGDKYRGRPITIAELYDEMGQRGVLSGMHHAEIDLDWSKGVGGGALMGTAVGASVAGIPGAAVGAAVGALASNHVGKMKFAFRAGELATELPTRMMLGLNVYKDTGSFRSMADDVRHYLHDYSELSVFEKRFMRRAIPFYNFVKMATRVVGNGLIDHPGRTLAPFKVFNAQNIAGTGSPFSSPIDNPVQPEDYPDYMHTHLKFMGRDTDEEGNLSTWLTAGFNLPVEEVMNLADIIGPGGKPLVSLGSRGPFGIMSLVEHTFNYDTFRLSRIEPEEVGGRTAFTSGNAFKGAPDWMKELVGYVEDERGRSTVNPKMAWLLGELPTSRFIRVAQQIYDVDDDNQRQGLNYRALSRAVLPSTTYRYDPETQQYFVNQAKLEAMERVLASIGRLRTRRISYTVDPEGGSSSGGASVPSLDELVRRNRALYANPTGETR